MRMKNHFHIKGSALNLVLIQRPGGTQKWPTEKVWRGLCNSLKTPFVFYAKPAPPALPANVGTHSRVLNNSFAGGGG